VGVEEAAVEEVVDDAVRVTPTLRQIASAAAWALARSEPVHVFSMQALVDWTKAELLQRHLLSDEPQPPKLASAKQVAAQLGRDWRLVRMNAEAEVAKAKRARLKCMIAEGKWGVDCWKDWKD